MIQIETWMFFLLPALAFAVLVFIGYLFYKNIIVPQQQEKAYWQEKYKYRANKEVS